MAKKSSSNSGKFSWCFGTPGHEIHTQCPHVVGGSTCSCDCHEDSE